MQREIAGRLPWDMCLLPRPHTPDVGLFMAGMQTLRAAGVTELPIEAARAANVASFALFAASSAPDVARGWDLVGRSMLALEAELRTAIDFHAPPLAEALGYIEDTVLRDERRCIDTMTAALGVRSVGQPLPIYLVPFAPLPPGSGFLTDHGVPRAAYLDYRRYSGPSMLEGVMTLLAWSLLRSATEDTSLSRAMARDLVGSDPAKRRLRAVVMKTLISTTAEHIATEYDSQFCGTTVAYGLDLRYPRLHAAIRPPWLHYLQGRTSREQAIGLINKRLAEQPASWFVEQIDASSLASDFYLLEWLAAQGDKDAAARLATWQPRLAAGFVRHLDFAIGAELAHYDGIPVGALAPEMIAFIRQACEGNSLLQWPTLRRSADSDAYRMAEAAFLGPGAEYGGDAWAPVARLMARYVDGALSDRVFIDQCFTLEHNNGCLFDKVFDTWDMQATLQAQARGDVAALGAHASAEVRRLLRRHLAAGRSERNWLWGADPEAIAAGQVPSAQVTWWTGAFHPWPPPGSVGCGSNVEPPGPGAQIPEEPGKPLFRGMIRKPHRRDVPELRSVAAVLHTDLGPIALNLRPAAAPLAVGTFVQLARGTVAWRDPATGGPATGPFYDDTRFHRIVPGFLLQAGDRTETGRGGPGFRYDEEPNNQKFDRPYLVGMVSTGIVTNGSQFFITLTKAPHLDGQYTIIGEVADEASRDVARQLSEARRAGRSDLRIKRVEVDAR